MPQYTITPWRHFSELIQLRSELFQLPNPPSATSSFISGNPRFQLQNEPVEDKRRQAVNLVAAWTMRGRVPHAVQSTAQLIEAQLHHHSAGAASSDETMLDADNETQENHPSHFSIRATYSAAFCSFITGYCDIGMAKLSMRKAMHEVAAELDMPASWVDLRHEATHGGKLPGVKRLEEATKGALVWLWKVYWERLEDEAAPGRNPNSNRSRRSRGVDSAEASSDVEGVKKRRKLVTAGPHTDVEMGGLGPGVEELLTGSGEDATTHALGRLLDAFVKARVEEIKERVVATSRNATTATTALEIIKRCRGYEQNLRNLVSVMVETKMMVPDKRKLKSPMQGAFLLWMPMIHTLTYYQTLFLPLLLKRIISILAHPVHLHAPPDTFREAILAWVDHILSSIPSGKAVGATTGEKLRSLVVEECVLSPPNDWTQPLARKIVDDGDAAFKRQWEIYLPGASNSKALVVASSAVVPT